MKDKLVEKSLIDRISFILGSGYKADAIAKRILQAILSDPNIVEIDPGAELPYDLCPISYKDAEGSVSNNLARAYYGMGMKDLKEKAGWVKPKEKK